MAIPSSVPSPAVPAPLRPRPDDRHRARAGEDREGGGLGRGGDGKEARRILWAGLTAAATAAQWVGDEVVHQWICQPRRERQEGCLSRLRVTTLNVVPGFTITIARAWIAR